MRIPQIIQEVQDRGWSIFTVGPYNLNIIVERLGNTPDAFDDLLHLVYRGPGGEWVQRSYEVTADPGVSALHRSRHPNGVAILAEGQYRGSHIIGLHKGYPALVQYTDLVVWRDRDRDGRITYTQKYNDVKGLNIHRAHPSRHTKKVGGYSEGCIVLANPVQYMDYWEVVVKAGQLYGPRMSTTLLDRVAGAR